MSEFSNVKKLYSELIEERKKYSAKWSDISKYAGIKSTLKKTTEVGVFRNGEQDNLDKYTYDPTAALSIQQSSDYLKGVVWGTGENVFEILPTDEVLSVEDISAVSGWYKFATDKILDQMNHSKSGLNNSLSECLYDFRCFGTAGIGAYPSSEKKRGVSENALIFRSYGVDTMCVDEGKNGQVDIIYNTYNWRLNRIISDFCIDESGNILSDVFSRLPQKIKDAYKNKNFNTYFKIIHAILPHEFYVPGKIGKNGCKYIGYWYFDDCSDDFFIVEHYREKPVAVGREDKVRGEVYGRSSGTMLLSSIKCVNEAVASTMETIDKIQNPPIGILNGSLFGDNKVNTSANGLTVFNASLLNGTNPIVKMQDVGDPTPSIEFILNYLNEKIATAFKIDLILDFAAKSNMTATETLQRFAIRGRALSTLITRIKVEILEPIIERCISILEDFEMLGVFPENEEEKKQAEFLGYENRVIPESVRRCMISGKKWYRIKFNNDIEKLTRVEIFEDLLKEINVINAILSLNPQMSNAVNWYGLIKKTSELLGFNDVVISEREFFDKVQKQELQQAQMQQMQMQMVESQVNKNNAGAVKDVGNK